MKPFAWWLAGGMLLAALVLGTADVIDPDGGSCGSVFVTRNGQNPYGEPFPDSAKCESARQQARQLPNALLIMAACIGLSQVPWRTLGRRDDA